jgi:cystathionine gamma-synthase
VDVRLIHFLICPEDKQNRSSSADVDSHGGGNRTRSPTSSSAAAAADLHIVLFPADDYPLAREFWQHSGLGISSRLAEHCLSMLPDDSQPSSPTYYSRPGSSKPMHKHYSSKSGSSSLSMSWSSSQQIDYLAGIETLKDDENVYLEERYGRNLSLSFAPSAKKALRRRIAGVLVHDSPDQCAAEPLAGSQEVEIGPSSRGVASVSEEDVFLYPTGMSAIWSAHMLISAVRPPTKSVCFGFVYSSWIIVDRKLMFIGCRFPYTDTLKVLQKWGPGCHFFGHGLDADIDELELMLEKEDGSNPPIQSLFTEFPSNPLLRSADLPRLRALANKYDFLIVIDETIGNFVNVEVLPYADIVVSSLSKVFSGDANVLGGRYVNHYE